MAMVAAAADGEMEDSVVVVDVAAIETMMMPPPMEACSFVDPGQSSSHPPWIVAYGFFVAWLVSVFLKWQLR
jgi:hypothetical protein